jgi:hypothetical protein
VSRDRSAGDRPVIHSELLPGEKMKVVVELRRPKRRIFEAVVPWDCEPEELSALVLDVQEILRRRRRARGGH